MYRATAAGDEARLKVLDQRRMQSRPAFANARAGEPAPVAGSGQYVLDFGKHSRKGLMEVWRSTPEYFGYLCSHLQFLESKPLLRRAMEEAGILAQAQSMGATICYNRSMAHIARAKTEDPAALHPEVAKLHRIKENEARAHLEHGE